MPPPTLFTRIANGEIPSAKIYEDDHTFAFLDINPASRGHTLVIPKSEFPDLFSAPPDILAAVARTTQLVAQALRAALKPDGLNIVQNNGKAAGQEIFHYHVHLIPRWEGDSALGLWRPHPADKASLAATAEAIRAAIP